MSAAHVSHPANLSRGVETMLRTQDELFKVVRRMAAQLRSDQASSELHQPFSRLVALLAEQSDATAVLAAALVEQQQPAAVSDEPRASLVAQSASLRDLDTLASSLVLA